MNREVRDQIMGIVIGSTFKGLVTGVCIGYLARKVNSLWLGILFGLAVGMFLALLVAAMPNPAGKHYYFDIMLPGSILGAVVGFATQRYKGVNVAPAPHLKSTFLRKELYAKSDSLRDSHGQAGTCRGFLQEGVWLEV